MKNIIFRKAQQLDVNNAVELAMKEFEVETLKCSTLLQLKKDDGDMQKRFVELITALFEQKYAYVAYDQHEMIGYLAFWGPIEGFFGNVTGAFAPLGGSGFKGNRAKISSMLLSYAMDEMSKKKVFSFALSRYAHDEEVARSLIMNGYGIRCSDAIQTMDYFAQKVREQNSGMPIKEVTKQDSKVNLTFRELAKDEFDQILELEQELCWHLAVAPVCSPSNLDICFPEHHVRIKGRIFVAADAGADNKIVGFIRVGDDGETVFTDYEGVQNICGACVDKDYRNHQVAEELLLFVANTLKQEGTTYLGVDCETLNPTALRFWAKNFQNYTYSFARRIDERVDGYEEYWSKRMQTTYSEKSALGGSGICPCADKSYDKA